jgi:hypothetical protein
VAVPTWVVGQVLTASDVNSWFVPLAAYKGADQSVTSSTTLVNDSALVVPVAANAVYDFSLRVFYTGGTTGTGDIITQLTVPSGTTGLLRIAGLNLSLAFQYGYRTIPIAALAFGGNGTSTLEVCEITGTVTTSSTAGNLQFQWAQNTSSATATTVKAGSVLVAQRIG